MVNWINTDRDVNTPRIDRKKSTFWNHFILKKLKRCTVKTTLITLTLATSLIIPITLPVFIIICFWTKSTTYLSIPFIFLDLKTIITFIIES